MILPNFSKILFVIVSNRIKVSNISIECIIDMVRVLVISVVIENIVIS